MRVLGIDPGIATVGFSILNYQNNRFLLERCGVITTPAHIRLFSPDAVSVEELFFDRNITTGIAVAHGRGAVLLACECAGVPFYEYTPMHVTQAVTGYGKADKHQVMDMVKRLCGLKDIPKPDDAADAVALAICHARSSGSLLTNRGDQTSCSTI